MSDIALLDPTTAAAARLHHGVLELAGRLGHLLGDDHEAAGFLAALGEQAGPGPAGPHPIDRLAVGLGLTRAEIDVVLLAGAAEEHEGLASVLRGLHPGHLPVATCGLVAALAEAGLLHDAPDDPVEARLWARSQLTGALDLVLVQGHGPFAERGLILPEGLWTALRGDPGWPAGAREIDTGAIGPLGLRAEQLSAALVACANGVPVTVVVDGAGDPVGAAMRLTPLLAGGGANPVVLTVPALPTAAGRAITLAALARGTTPVLVADDLPDGVAALDGVPAPSVLVTSGPVRIGTTSRAVLPVRVPPPSRSQRRQLWARLTPDCPDAAEVVPPGCGVAVATELARDAATAALLSGTHVRQRDLRAALDIRGGDRTPAGVQRIRPVAGWDDLVLPEDRLTQLHEAVARVRAQDVVLGRWGFLADRPGRYGVRALFCGPPGTGKTLAGEVLAGAMGRDLLVVDLSRMTSKWIGETEKNLAEAFDAAERGDAVLLFDEADALFGKRTEVGDARDRYANLETAYLLSRLSWFDGVAVLATNLRHNVDPAFTRRLEFVVAFDPPDEEQRVLLWRRHLPATAPLAADVDLGLLALRYPVTGALIRNAAVAAAFLAAEAGTPIGAAQLAWAMRREYAKAGRAYPAISEESP
ncbi:ATP-binding protein [Lentzea sp. BCCO 10_0856]|uniref:ATP-binding protein n=1 Tax=Lentzea miocenica TaxID=3095431 RepID=A0ABU4SZQ7_9PSEU|nr:ATP-binding protein [Lentzea sp. BCCO 10_0856]MDX8031397.1 ATP-binding protein [Lentzea sp. BCCO 10_0856]